MNEKAPDRSNYEPLGHSTSRPQNLMQTAIFVLLLVLGVAGATLGGLYASGIWPGSSSSNALLDGSSTSSASRLSSSLNGINAIMLFMGQSNNQGYGEDLNLSIDTTHSAMFQYVIGDGSAGLGGYAGSLAGTIQPAREILFDGAYTAGVAPLRIGNAVAFGRTYLAANPSSTLTIVQASITSTPLVSSSPNSWNSSLPNGLFVRAKNALAAAFALKPDSILIGVHWIQGEQDATHGITTAVYQDALTALIIRLRATFAGATIATPFVITSMVPEQVALNPANLVIQIAQQNVARALNHVVFRLGPSGCTSPSALFHYSADGQRLIGSTLLGALTQAQTSLATQSSSSNTASNG